MIENENSKPTAMSFPGENELWDKLYALDPEEVSKRTGVKCLPNGKLVGLESIKGGQFFFRAGHELPLAQVANKYKNDLEGFCKKGISLGGMKALYQDASIYLYPLPNIPIVYILWREEEEFPARVSILFDETIEKHMVLEGLWGIAFFTARQLLVD
ncbi:DUF3786 domain-containing protein [Candidatus Poribacteria bacterium]|nr:DUF3786 domain-containing protein [Candidatus Poribacteria bacterium]